ncbi:MULTISPECIES: VOC family protein [unclassified Nocardiopsis]|uniref:VOC family protein n=1 Tax=Nocardiopsis TaxID=2013 RepID=UPI00387AC6D5
MLRGLTTVTLWADDVAEAARWYTGLLGTDPYFERPGNGLPPGYIEFRIGDHQHELGIADRRYAPPAARPGPGGTVVYWHVDDVEAALARLLELGAEEYEPLTVRGEGFVTASVVDPFGNVLGVMYNAHYLDMLQA